MASLIRIRDLTKRFGPLVAVDRVSFGVERGEVLGFLGPNGAGKSTTMRMITGFLAPDGGTVEVCGHDVVEQPIAVKATVGYLPEGAPLYADMTPPELLRFAAEARGLSRSRARERIGWAIDRLELGSALSQSIETLSKGFKRRVGLALALLHDPEVLVMDEPTDGLDPNQKHQVRELIRELAPQKAIIISTHILEEVDAVCSRAAIISRGRLVADGTPAELAARSRYHNAVALTVKGVAPEEVRSAFTGVPGVGKLEVGPTADGLTSCIIFPRSGQPIVAEVSRHLQGRGWEVDELHVEAGRLDEVFRSVTTAAGASGGQAKAPK